VPDLTAEALWYVGPGHAEIREEPLAEPGPGEVRVRALYSAISRGTERLVSAGRIPESEFERMRAPFMGGSFPFPVKYGYSTVGRVEAGAAEMLGRIVFVLHPHQRLFNVPLSAVVALPDGVPPARAARYYNVPRNEKLLLGLRPEHLFEYHEQGKPGWSRVELPVDVVEPMGMETMVHFFIDGAPICARVDPATHAAPGEMMPLTADLNQMHLMEADTGKVV